MGGGKRREGWQEWIVLVAKEPRPGLSKTRLARDVGEKGAQRLAEAFVLDTLRATSSRPGTRLLIAYAPADARPWFEERAPGATFLEQPNGDLGQRMLAGVDAALRAGASAAVLLGMDTPHLEPAVIDDAFAALRSGSDVALGPSEDGGYYLLGLRERWPALFEGVPWSTDSVAAATLSRIAELRLAVQQLPREFDVDTGADLTLLRERLWGRLRARPEVAQATRQALAELGHL